MFQTRIDIPLSKFKIEYTDNIMSLGSCFSANMGEKLQHAFFSISNNPFGVLFNPLSISANLRRLQSGMLYEPEDFFLHASVWNNFSFSNLYSGISLEESMAGINDRFTDAADFLKQADCLLVTFGTSWVYEQVETGEIVANCHKLPAASFRRRRLTVDEIVSDYKSLLKDLDRQGIRQVIFTVSPVRHWKDGAHENNLSKAILHLAIEEITLLFDYAQYFPAYEIQMDELRDYRFYGSDMFHPSETAVDYIWQRFSETFFSEETNELRKELELLYRQINHRSIHPGSDLNLKFQEQLEDKKGILKNKYPFLRNRL